MKFDNIKKHYIVSYKKQSWFVCDKFDKQIIKLMHINTGNITTAHCRYIKSSSIRETYPIEAYDKQQLEKGRNIITHIMPFIEAKNINEKNLRLQRLWRQQI